MGRRIAWFILVPAGIAAAFFGAIRFMSEGMCTLSRESMVPADFSSLGSAVKSYKLNGGQYPTTDQGLEALVTKPATEPVPGRWAKIADVIPKDPWMNPYRYRLLSQDGDPAFEITSAGKDGVFGTKDDLSSLDKEP